jgi:hypothetical protein
MTSNDLIVREYNAVEIMQCRQDRYLDATAMCVANGKLWTNYWQTKNAKAFVNELSLIIGIPIIKLVESRAGRYGGTFIHPRIALHLAQWISPKFAVAVSGWVDELLTTGIVTVATTVTDKINLMRQQLDLMERMEVEAAQTKAVAVTALQTAERVEDRLQQTQANAQQAHTLAQAAVDIHSSNYGYYSVLGWGRLKNLPMDIKLASIHGRKLSKICRTSGRDTGTVRDSRWGIVNTYPEDILQRYFEETDDK